MGENAKKKKKSTVLNNRALRLLTNPQIQNDIVKMHKEAYGPPRWSAHTGYTCVSNKASS